MIVILAIAFLFVVIYLMSTKYIECDCKVYINSEGKALAMVYIDEPFFEEFIIKDEDMINFIKEHDGETVKCKVKLTLTGMPGSRVEYRKVINIYE